MNIDRKTKDELNALSKEIFGASSRWQKLINDGYSKLVTEEVTEFVPDEAHPEGGTTRKVNVPVKTKGMHQYVTERHTVESVKTLLLDLKRQKDEYFAKQKKAQEEAQLQKQLQENVAGSAV